MRYENGKSSMHPRPTMPNPPHAAMITHHADNLGPFSRHGKPS